ncbi:Xaa-Pro peptidase family protein [Patescibacteria group bacterium]|nr:Xaa-Pro peptidase family protein [Patescibacteria group bacterium]MBU1015963.1 Xaa-Pro peptidase family protein [Patescibacteria group bacterium]MBU1685311.1 Xaa-Pro peptidase family protein [Patescibacteria group bacterium]MBU1939098.1 Xaa-Pro peptidase family protein [Patescibacteria group bacterium]
MRIKKLQKLIKAQKLGALLVSDRHNVRYLSGFVGTNGKLLVTPAKHVLITDARYFETARKAGVPYYDQERGLKKLMSRFKTIGFEAENFTVARLKKYKKALPGVKFKPTTGLVESLRKIKDEAEIRIIKKAVKIACKSLRELAGKLKPGVTEDELEWELLKIARTNGADGFSFPPIITFGKDTADIHHQKGESKLKKGEMVLVDFGLVYKGYITDMTRVFFQRKPTPFEQKIYSTVLAANRAAIKAIKVGMRCAALDKAARDVIEKSGFGKYFTHSTGHGTGLEVHEAPRVSHKSKDRIRSGMVFTIEPGIYVPGKAGVRIEDMIYVNSEGKAEVLTKFAKNL